MNINALNIRYSPKLALDSSGTVHQSCPKNNTCMVWQDSPALHVVNHPNANGVNADNTQLWQLAGNSTSDPSISITQQRINATTPLQQTSLAHQLAVTTVMTHSASPAEESCSHGRALPAVCPRNSYITSTTAGEPKFVPCPGQFNLTHPPLAMTWRNKGKSDQPSGDISRRNLH